MTALTEGSPAGGEPSRAHALPDDVPSRATGAQLLGAMTGSGYRTPPALVRRADGQVIQLSPLLYLLLEEMDGRRTYEQIAEAVSQRYGKRLAAGDVVALVDGKLRPLGVVRLVDGGEPAVRRSNPLLALRFRYVVSNPERTRRVTAPFARLFHPLAIVLVTLAFAAVAFWVLFEKGLASAAHQAFTDPGLLLAVFAITVLSAGFHEFGHAAALRRGGGTPGAMGAGLYLVWPAFYTDVTDSYRLGRAARLRTDLGGLYFNAVLSLVMFGGWLLTRWDGLLLVIATQILQMVRQLPPLLRFDGYHILADMTGVPDLFHRIGPILRSLVPGRPGAPQAQALRPWARAVVTVWVVVVVPLMLLSAVVAVLSLPRIIGTGWHSLQVQAGLAGDRFHSGDLLGALAKVLAIVAIGVPMFGIVYMVVRTGRRLAVGTWRKTAGQPAKQALAAVATVAVVCGLAYAWWPNGGNYRPIQAYERGTVQDALPVAAISGSALHEGREATARTIWPNDGTPLPTADHPVLAVVMVPRTDHSKPTWVFPFNRPAAPGPGDNQALAIATANGSTAYSVAFALVWASSDVVANKNEAYAFASCTGCRAVAMSFQVVLIVGDAQVVVPENLSAAVNYNCTACVTQALAMQLVLSVPGQPSPAEQKAIAALWQQIAAFSARAGLLSFAAIQSQLTAYERQIDAVITQYSPTAGTPATTTPPTGPSATSATSAVTAPPTGSAPEQANESGGSEPTDSATDSAAAPSSGDVTTPAGTDGGTDSTSSTGTTTDTPDVPTATPTS